MSLVFDPTFAPAGSVLSTANSTTANLGVGGVFTGTAENVRDYASIQIAVFADQVSAALGLSIQQSTNGTNWDFVDTYTVPASGGKIYSVAPAASFFRIVYTNGGVAQTIFRLQVVFHYTSAKGSTHSLAETITLQNDAELVIAQLRATNGLNSVPLQADASGYLLTAGVTAANTNGSIVNTALTGTTASSATAPANAIGFIIEAPSTNDQNIRWCVGGTASTTVGMLMEPGRDSGYVPVNATISVCSTVSGTNAFSIQWIRTV